MQDGTKLRTDFCETLCMQLFLFVKKLLRIIFWVPFKLRFPSICAPFPQQFQLGQTAKFLHENIRKNVKNIPKVETHHIFSIM